MRTFPTPLFGAALLLLVSVNGIAATERGFAFEGTPKAFQKNPRLEMTVFTEFTDAGKALPAVSNDAPVYYALGDGKYLAKHDLWNSEPPKPDEMRRMLVDGLRARGYRPADATHRASVYISFAWGAHMYPEGSEDNSYSEPAVLMNVLDRAALVGGDKFAHDLARALVQRSNVYAASARPLPLQSPFAANEPELGGPADVGAATGMARINANIDPVKLFIQRSAKTEFLVAQATDDCYFVIASAYDLNSVAKNQRQLLWRTRMTVNARSVSQAYALPLLVSNTAPFLGRDMAEPEVMTRRGMRETQVDIGAPTVIEAVSEKPSTGK